MMKSRDLSWRERLIGAFVLLAGFMLLLRVFGTTSAHAGPVKIGFVLSTLQEERYQKDQRYFKEEAAKLGFEPVMVSADNNEQTQTSKVENLLSMGVKAIIVQPVNSQAAGSLVKLAHDEKIPLIAYDRMITNAPVDFFVTMDAFQVGVLQAEAAVKFTKGKGNYVILMGQAGHSAADEITRGNLSVLKKYPKIKVVLQKNHNAWSGALAMATTENVLTQHKNKIDAILANNSGMARGAVQALTEQGLTGKVFVAGSDADLTAIKDIVAGRQQFEVLKEIKPLAVAAADVAFQLAKGEKPTSKLVTQTGHYRVPTIATPVYAVDKNNLEERIIKTGFHSKKDVYGN